jgi:hypothetical protein
MTRCWPSVIALVALTACSHPMLPYTPEHQPEGAKISAAYQMLANRLRIELDTDHRRLEDIWIVRSDGNAIRAQTIENAPTVTGPGPTIGIGIGGASIGRGSAIGTGVGVGMPVGEGPTRIEGSTFATFPLDQVGPPPWSLHVKLAGVAPTIISVGGPTPAR